MNSSPESFHTAGATDFDRWIAAQRITLLAYRQSLRPPLLELPLLLAGELNRALAQWPHFIRDLPRHSLALLKSLHEKGRLGAECDALGDQWSACWTASHLAESSARLAPYRAARPVADWLLLSAGDPARLPHLATSLLSRHFWSKCSQDDVCCAKIRDLVQSLRSAGAPAAQRVNAIVEMSLLFDQSPHWPQVANVLYHRLYSWPLLVSPLGGAISLPIGIEITLENGPGVVVEKVHCRHIDASGWTSSLERAVKAAKVLWLGRNRIPRSVRDQVRGAGVMFSLREANRIAEALQGVVRLDGRSMEAYFSQAVLGCLLGNVSSLSSTATGLIGDPILDAAGEPSLSDFWLEWPTEVYDKLEWVFRVGLFDRFVHPGYSRIAPESAQAIQNYIHENNIRQTAAVNGVETLARLADCLQPYGWRQDKYIRCPDVGRYIASGAGPPTETEGVRRCLEILRTNSEPILELPAGISAFDVAGALFHLDRKVRKAMPLDDGGGTRGRPYPLSWTFARVAPEEEDEQLWQVIWRITGAPAAGFQRFRESDTSQVAAACLVDAFNCFEPKIPNLRHRSPDVLVLIGTRRMRERGGWKMLAAATTFAPASWRPLAFDSVLEALGPWLCRHSDRPLPQNRLADLLGNTRILLIPDDRPLEEPIDPATLSTDRARAALARLAIFRFGFTNQMAALVLQHLRHRGPGIPDFFKHELRLGPTFQGQYYLPGRIGQQSEPCPEPETLAQLHDRAGYAFAPYLARGNVSGVSRDRAFLPENVQEAEYHFERALHFAKQGKRTTRFRNRVKRQLRRVQQFTGMDDWHIVGRLLRTRVEAEHAYAIVRRRLETAVRSGSELHPRRLLLAAQAVELRRADFLKPPRDEHQADRLLSEMIDLLDRALRGCEHSPGGDQNRLRVLSSYAVILEKVALATTDAKVAASYQMLAQGYSQQAIELIDSGTTGNAAIGAWYEMQGDQEQDPRRAAQIYGQGVVATPVWAQLWVKWAGARQLAGDKNDAIWSDLSKVPENHLRGLIVQAGGAFRAQYGRAGQDVVKRWRIGVAQIEEVWGKSIELRSLIQQWLVEHECEGPNHEGDRRVFAQEPLRGGGRFYCQKCRKVHKRQRIELEAALSQEFPNDLLTRLMPGYRPGRIKMLGNNRIGKGFGIVRSIDTREYYFDGRHLLDGTTIASLSPLQTVQYFAAVEPGPRNKFVGTLKDLRPL